MQIVVLGAGAIGSLYGAKLAGDNEVTLVGRPEHVAEIGRHGLRIEGLERRTVRVRATTRLSELAPGTLILLTTKVPSTVAAFAPLVPMLRDDTTIVALQNGLNSDEIARGAIQNRTVVLRGITQFGATFDRPGVVRYMAAGHTIIENHERSARIAMTLSAAGLDCRVSTEMRTEIWRKVIFNCVVNPITAILGSKVGAIVDPRLARLKQMVIGECVAVAAAEGIQLEGNFLREIDAAYAGSQNIVSMRQDLLRGRQTEIDSINGAVAALGARHGLDCPLNDGLTRIIKGMEAPRNNRGGPRLPPQELETKIIARAGVRAPEINSSEIIR